MSLISTTDRHPLSRNVNIYTIYGRTTFLVFIRFLFVGGRKERQGGGSPSMTISDPHRGGPERGSCLIHMDPPTRLGPVKSPKQPGFSSLRTKPTGGWSRGVPRSVPPRQSGSRNVLGRVRTSTGGPGPAVVEKEDVLLLYHSK